MQYVMSFKDYSCIFIHCWENCIAWRKEKLDFQESQNSKSRSHENIFFCFFFMCPLLLIQWFGLCTISQVQKNQQIGKINLFKKDPWSFEVIFLTPGMEKTGKKGRRFSFFALELVLGGSVINLDYPVLFYIDYSWIFFYQMRKLYLN